MNQRAFRLPFRLAGIPLYVDLSFLIILPLMVWTIARNIVYIVREGGVGIDPAIVSVGFMPLALGVVGALGLFTCVVLHELGHSITAQRYGVKVRRITLWFLGGVAEFEEIPRQRGAEAVVAIAGPLVSFALAGVFFALTRIVPRTLPSVWLISLYLFYVNMMLGLFNLLPALPLDGGRILRSLLALKMPYLRATAVAGQVAKIIAVLMGLWGLGLLSALLGGPIRPNLWMIVVAFFIYMAANSETQQALIVEMLKGIGVRELMNPGVRTVPAWMTVGQLYQFMIQNHLKGFPVVDQNNRLIGMIEMSQLQSVDPNTPVWQVMSTEVRGINQRASALDAFAEISRNGFGRLVVFDDDKNMVGIITKTDLMRAIQIRMTGYEGWGSPMAVRHTPGAFSPPPDYIPQHVRAAPAAGTYAAAATTGYTPPDGDRHPQ
jgi:Zn-dependent protease/CBS domain-containing protein